MGSLMQIMKCDSHHKNTQIYFLRNQKLEKTCFGGNFKRFFCVLLLLLVSSGGAWASSEVLESRETEVGGHWLHFYKTIVSATDGDRCGMSPSCSSYAAQAFKKHGFLMGWFISCDRLIRCGRDEKYRSPHIKSGNRILTRDTLEDNDFWWYDKP